MELIDEAKNHRDTEKLTETTDLFKMRFDKDMEEDLKAFAKAGSLFPFGKPKDPQGRECYSSCKECRAGEDWCGGAFSHNGRLFMVTQRHKHDLVFSGKDPSSWRKESRSITFNVSMIMKDGRRKELIKEGVILPAGALPREYGSPAEGHIRLHEQAFLHRNGKLYWMVNKGLS